LYNLQKFPDTRQVVATVSAESEEAFRALFTMQPQLGSVGESQTVVEMDNGPSEVFSDPSGMREVPFDDLNTPPSGSNGPESVKKPAGKSVLMRPEEAAHIINVLKETPGHPLFDRAQGNISLGETSERTLDGTFMAALADLQKQEAAPSEVFMPASVIDELLALLQPGGDEDEPIFMSPLVTILVAKLSETQQ